MYKILFFVLIVLNLLSCKSSIKQQSDSVYSRHLQRHVPLTIITTAMPNKKEQMNLLLFNNPELLEDVRAKKIIDSLFKEKLIQPLTLVAFEGKSGDYGLEEANIAAAKQYKKFNEFIINELYPFIKKKVVVRKFNSVAICGFGESAICAFDIAWNHDDKIQKVGMFLPTTMVNDTTTFETIAALRKRPNIKIWITDDGNYDSSIIKMHQLISYKNNTTKAVLINAPSSSSHSLKKYNFVEFLLWTFPK